jgi:hypothetical protein
MLSRVVSSSQRLFFQHQAQTRFGISGFVKSTSLSAIAPLHGLSLRSTKMSTADKATKAKAAVLGALVADAASMVRTFCVLNGLLTNRQL